MPRHFLLFLRWVLIYFAEELAGIAGALPVVMFLDFGLPFLYALLVSDSFSHSNLPRRVRHEPLAGAAPCAVPFFAGRSSLEFSSSHLAHTHAPRTPSCMLRCMHFLQRHVPSHLRVLFFVTPSTDTGMKELEPARAADADFPGTCMRELPAAIKMMHGGNKRRSRELTEASAAREAHEADAADASRYIVTDKPQKPAFPGLSA